MPDITTKYLGLELGSPLVVSASPLSKKIDNILEMEDCGAGAVVLFSLFEEQIRAETEAVERVVSSTEGIFAEASGYFPAIDEFKVGPSAYLELISKAKERTGIPVIASLNGVTPEGWIEYARDIESAGADAIEINVYFIPADVTLEPQEVERRYEEITAIVRKTVSIPIAVKLNPYFSAIGNTALRLQQAGADGFVLFNRFYQPDLDIEELRAVPDLELSHPSEIRLPLLWIAVLYGRIPASLAATTGIHGARELIKYLLAGADAGMVASVLLKNGIHWISDILDDLRTYMDSMGFASLNSFKGSLSQRDIADPTAYERSNYIQIIDHGKWG